MKRAPRSLQHHVLYRKYNGQDSEISALLGKCGVNMGVQTLVHEIVHAIYDVKDIEVPLNGDQARTKAQYLGECDLIANSIMLDRGSPAQVLSYSSHFASYYSGANSISYTFGQEIDIALFTTLQLTDNAGNFLPGPNVKTFRNTESTRDLIIGKSEIITFHSEIFTGLGNDFVYMYEGNDTVNGGSGNDYLNGGDDIDTATYLFMSGDASGEFTNGISATFSGQSGNFSGFVVDGWGGTDNLVEIEIVTGTTFDDRLIFKDDFETIAYSSMEGSGLQRFDALDDPDREEVGDTLALFTSGGVEVNLSTEIASSGEATVQIVHFENVIGSDHNDTITGDDELNIIKGRGGDDSIFGGQDGNPPVAGTPEIIDTLDGGNGNDTVSAGAGLDSVFGGSGDDTLIEHVNADIADQEDGGTLYGGEGNDTIDVSVSADASTLFGGSGNDILYGNGASTLFGGSGVDEFHIVTVSTPQTPGMPPLITFDTIADAETQDRLWIDGVEITVDSPDVIFAREVGGIEGHGYAPVLFNGELVEVFSSITAPITVLFVATGLADDFSGKLQDIVRHSPSGLPLDFKIA